MTDLSADARLLATERGAAPPINSGLSVERNLTKAEKGPLAQA